VVIIGRVEDFILQANSNNKRRWVDREPHDLAPGDGAVDIGTGLEFSQDDVQELLVPNCRIMSGADTLQRKAILYICRTFSQHHS
jgi:hypothetical protein